MGVLIVFLDFNALYAERGRRDTNFHEFHEPPTLDVGAGLREGTRFFESWTWEMTKLQFPENNQERRNLGMAGRVVQFLRKAN
jgi:hypothetical protein